MHSLWPSSGKQLFPKCSFVNGSLFHIGKDCVLTPLYSVTPRRTSSRNTVDAPGMLGARGEMDACARAGGARACLVS